MVEHREDAYMSIKRIFLLLLAVALLAPATVGCGISRLTGCTSGVPDGLVESDLVGRYKRDNGDEMALKADHAASAVVNGQDRTGTWKLDLDSPGTEDMMIFLGGARDQWWITGSRKKPELYQFNGDPDNCDTVTFVRV
jgi:hypothetical protein